MFNISYLQAENLGIEIILSQNSQLSYPLHNHISVFIIGIILEGIIKLTLNERTTNISEQNQLFIIPPYLPHKIETTSNYSLLSICIDKQRLTTLTMTELTTILESLVTKSFKEKPGAIKQILNLLDNLNGQNFSPISLPSKIYFAELKKQIEDAPELNYRIESMAEKVFSSKYYFIRNFKKIVGLTPHQFQIQNRIRKAQKLLAKTPTITEVALTTGFCDQSHFIKQFKKIVRLTPSNYLRACHKLKINPSS